MYWEIVLSFELGKQVLDWENKCWTGKTSVGLGKQVLDWENKCSNQQSDYMHMIIVTKYEREREKEKEREKEREREYTTRNQYTKNHLRI